MTEMHRSPATRSVEPSALASTLGPDLTVRPSPQGTQSASAAWTLSQPSSETWSTTI